MSSSWKGLEGRGEGSPSASGAEHAQSGLPPGHPSRCFALACTASCTASCRQWLPLVASQMHTRASIIQQRVTLRGVDHHYSHRGRAAASSSWGWRDCNSGVWYADGCGGQEVVKREGEREREAGESERTTERVHSEPRAATSHPYLSIFAHCGAFSFRQEDTPRSQPCCSQRMSVVTHWDEAKGSRGMCLR